MKEYKLPPEYDGLTKDLPEYISTMNHVHAECPHCESRLIRNSRKVFCHLCGFWWDISKLEVAK